MQRESPMHSYQPDPRFMFDGGTSLATPLVAGCAAVDPPRAIAAGDPRFCRQDGRAGGDYVGTDTIVRGRTAAAEGGHPFEIIGHSVGADRGRRKVLRPPSPYSIGAFSGAIVNSGRLFSEAPTVMQFFAVAVAGEPTEPGVTTPAP